MKGITLGLLFLFQGTCAATLGHYAQDWYMAYAMSAISALIIATYFEDGTK